MITPQESYPKLSNELGVSALYFKREDLHPHRSHKGRSIPVMIEKYSDAGFSHFAISSSGNAALSAALTIKSKNADGDQKTKLDIFVGKNIQKEKLEMIHELTDEYIHILKEDRPLQKLFEVSKDPRIKALRQSTDDFALIGYEELGRELMLIPDLKAVVIPTSSGTCAQALGAFFLQEGKEVEIHIVQTSFCHPLSDAFGPKEGSSPSIADAIVDKVGHRKEAVVDIIKKTGGFGWIASNDEITAAQIVAKEHTGVALSPNSALSLAGVIKATQNGRFWKTGSVACLITGR